MTDKSKSREAFEKWAEDKREDLYGLEWQAWQASRQALIAEAIERMKKQQDKTRTDHWNYAMYKAIEILKELNDGK